MSRSRTVERKKERQGQRRRQQRTILVIGAIVAAVIIVGLIVIVSLPAEAPIPTDTQDRYAGLQQGKTTDGFPTLGNSDTRVKVSLYSSFSCTNCRAFHDAGLDSVLQRVRSGAISLIYVPLYVYGEVTNGQGAAVAAMCAGEQGAFWQMNDALFKWQGIYANQAFSNSRLSAGIAALGLDRGRFDECVNSGRTNDILTTAQSQAQGLSGFTGTPTIAINGVIPVDSNNALIDPLNDLTGLLNAIDQAVTNLGGIPPTVMPTGQATPESTPEMTATSESTATSQATAEVTATSASTRQATPETTQAAP